MLAHIPIIVAGFPFLEWSPLGMPSADESANCVRSTREDAMLAHSKCASTPRVRRADAAAGLSAASICRTVKDVDTFASLR
jgi:hypothetical protein